MTTITRFGAMAVLFGWMAAAAAADAGPEAAIRAFYTQYGKMKLTGIPAPADQKRLASWLSRGLQDSLDRARVEQRRCQKKFPDEKPPWIEGDLFTSVFEGFTQVEVKQARPDRPHRFAVAFVYVEPGSRFAWVDDVEVVREGGKWKVDNVHFRPEEGTKADLRGGLASPGCDR